MAAKQMLSKGVRCIQPSLIKVWGKVKVICFDKTGTLTRGGLKFDHAIAVSPKSRGSFARRGRRTLLEDDDYDNPIFGNATSSLEHLPPFIQMAMATCHSLSKVSKDE
jgi:cation-transporting ATPase 13A3/4/5